MSKFNKTIPGVTLQEGPSDWQIIQRNQAGQCSIKIRGIVETVEKVFRAEARLVFENSGMPVASRLDWRPATMRGKCFSMRLAEIPAGGLYRLETRVTRPFALDRRPMRGDCVHHLGVGDLYVIAGQSNASGTGKGMVHDGPELGVHLFGNDNRWRLATHPLEDATRTRHPITVTSVFHGHSPWLHFARILKQHAKIPIGLLPTALGGSPLSMWIRRRGMPSNPALFRNMADMIDRAGGDFTGLIWYQGESDVDANSRRTYRRDFACLAAAIRRRYRKPNLPILLGQLSSKIAPLNGATTDADWTAMRQLQREIARTVKKTFLVTTLDLPLSDEIHLSTGGNLLLAERFVQAALYAIYQYPITAAHPEPQRIDFIDRQRRQVRVVFRNLSGNFIPISLPVAPDFCVTDSKGIVPIRHTAVNAANHVTLTLDRSASGPACLHGAYGCNPAITLRDDGGRCVTPFTEPIHPAR